MTVVDSASIDLNQVGVFVRVVEAGSFTAAAADLRLPKSSVSRKVTALEDALGMRLLQRTTRRLRLTEAGQRYFQRARQALLGLEEAAGALAEIGGEPRGRVRISAADFQNGPLGEVIAAFVRLHPTIQVDLTLTGRKVNLIEEGFDLAVRAGILEDSTLVARRVARSELRLYAAPAYLARRGAPRRLVDLARHDGVVYRTTKGTLPWRLTGSRGVEAARITAVVSADDMAFLRRLIVAGVGIGLLPDALGESDVASGDLVPVLPAYAMRGGAIYVVSPPLRHLPARVALLRDFLITELPRALAAGRPGR